VTSMTTYRILYADNDLDSLEIVRKYLESLGYLVDTAPDPDQAREKLRSSYYDLAILDMRLRDNDDEADKSGLEIAKTEARSIPKIIYTAYPQIEDAIEAVRKDREELPPAIDYLDKTRGLDGIRDAVEAAIHNYLDHGGELSIVWPNQGFSSFAQLVAIAGLDLSVGLAELADELEMLFRQAFSQYEQISLTRVLWTGPGRGLVQVSSFHHNVEDDYLVTYGDLEAVKMELDLHQATVPASSDSDLPVVFSQKTSVHLGLIVWLVRGVDLLSARPAAEFFEGHSDRQIQEALLSLFTKVGKTWYRQGRIEGQKPADAAPEAAWLTRQEFGDALHNVIQSAYSRDIFPIRATPEGLRIALLKEKTEKLPNPVDYLFGDKRPAVTGKTALTLGIQGWDSILVDAEGRAWPVDFGNIHQTTIWRDFVTLEVEARFNFLEIRDLYTLLDFEEQLFSTQHLRDAIPARYVLPGYRKVLCIIQTIRKSAAEYFGDDLPGYLAALLFAAARGLGDISPQQKLTSREVASYTYRILLMGKICAYLEQNGQKSRSSQPDSDEKSLTIRIDPKQRQVWVGKYEKKLTHTEYDILKYLYDADRVCTRQELLTSIFKFTGPIDRSARNLINIHINRLRKQIEPDPGNPIFILTVRKEGYRLDRKG